MHNYINMHKMMREFTYYNDTCSSCNNTGSRYNIKYKGLYTYGNIISYDRVISNKENILFNFLKSRIETCDNGAFCSAHDILFRIT